MIYKVCILAAGDNKRNLDAKGFNNALLPVGDQAGLSRLIEKFSDDVEILIAIGYNGHLIREFTRAAYFQRKFTFVEVHNFNGHGSGVGQSLLCCKELLQCPFIFSVANAIVLEEIPSPKHNWIGIGKVLSSDPYLMIETSGGLVTTLHDKKSTQLIIRHANNYGDILNNGFIGMAGIHDYSSFWDGLESNRPNSKDASSITNGIENLLKRQVQPLRFTWFDTGSEVGYNLADRFFSKGMNNVKKKNEFLYFENKSVIKYFDQSEVVKKRIYRSEVLGNIVPKLTFKGEYFYAYQFIEGYTLSQITDVSIFYKLLEFCSNKIWKPISLKQNMYDDFVKQCSIFYEKKTRGRVDKIYTEMGLKDREEVINGVLVPKTTTLLGKIDWAWLSKGVPVLFHGDLQPENIIVGSDDFKLIDWRHEFGSLVDYGDIYYDFAKLHHALTVTHEVIRKNEYSIDINEGIICYDFLLKNNLLTFLNIFEKFLVTNGYDLKKVRILSALIYLNISPLHEDPYGKFLYYHGKYKLFYELKN
jgi:hypothetical protein